MRFGVIPVGRVTARCALAQSALSAVRLSQSASSDAVAPRAAAMTPRRESCDRYRRA